VLFTALFPVVAAKTEATVADGFKDSEATTPTAEFSATPGSEEFGIFPSCVVESDMRAFRKAEASADSLSGSTAY
jgi:hypothetical protein